MHAYSIVVGTFSANYLRALTFSLFQLFPQYILGYIYRSKLVENKIGLSVLTVSNGRLRHSLYFSLCLSLSLSLSLSVSLSVSVSLCMSISVSLCLSLSLSAMDRC